VLEAVRTDDAPEESAAPAECLHAALGDIGPLDAEVVSSFPERFPMPPAALRLVLRNLLRNAVAAGAARISVRGIAALGRGHEPLINVLIVDDHALFSAGLRSRLEQERDQEIANRLFISVRTVNSHRAHVMQKLRLETRAELVLLALSSGVVGGAG
jgi:signal transduction histidine kinase